MNILTIDMNEPLGCGCIPWFFTSASQIFVGCDHGTIEIGREKYIEVLRAHSEIKWLRSESTKIWTDAADSHG